eukprot:gb/GECH01013691.1/.p1 GENE.gb/GECH01013691.1/~~gb/GECH01013691.1/.p1  ORF type:complete len:362 (+),score=89.94 gb/GECH01013691.1/:1-1086(+)
MNRLSLTRRKNSLPLASVSNSQLSTNSNQDKIIRQGYLWREGTTVKKWKYRWFKLKRSGFQWYSVNNHDRHQGTIPLKYSAAAETLDKNRKFSFKIVTQHRTFYLAADSHDSQKKWLDALHATIDSVSGNRDTIKISEEKDEETLSIKDQYEIAISAASIFMKNSDNLTPEEKAYIIALAEWRRQYEEHCIKYECQGCFNLAEGTMAFTKESEERNSEENEFVEQIANTYDEQVKYEKEQLENNDKTLDDEIEIVRGAGEIAFKDPKTRSQEENLYMEYLRESARKISVYEYSRGIEAQHTLSSGTITLAIPPNERTISNQEYIEAVEELVREKRNHDPWFLTLHQNLEHHFKKHQCIDKM